MALAIHYEASKTLYKDQVGVYQVIVNRARKLNKGFCEVIKQAHQFSFVKASMKWQATKKQLELLDKIRKEPRMFSKDVLFFHSKRNDPSWAKRMKLVMIIGKHRYFRLKES